MHTSRNRAGKQKGPGYEPGPDYYQSVVHKVLHEFPVTRSNFKNTEASPYKPETTLSYVRSSSINAIALIIAPKRLQRVTSDFGSALSLIGFFS